MVIYSIQCKSATATTNCQSNKHLTRTNVIKNAIKINSEVVLMKISCEKILGQRGIRIHGHSTGPCFLALSLASMRIMESKEFGATS